MHAVCHVRVKPFLRCVQPPLHYAHGDIAFDTYTKGRIFMSAIIYTYKTQYASGGLAFQQLRPSQSEREHNVAEDSAHTNITVETIPQTSTHAYMYMCVL